MTDRRTADADRAGDATAGPTGDGSADAGDPAADSDDDHDAAGDIDADPDAPAGSDDAPDDEPGLAAQRGMETEVYQPAEDSGLLADAGVEFARGRTLEVGTGSGWVAAKVAAETDAAVVASDVNPHACAAARDRGLETVRADLLAPFAADSLDTLLFNPPYLPTDPDNEWDDWMEQALSGGESGRELIEPFLDDAGRVLTTGGQVLLLVSSLAGYEAVVDLARAAGFTSETVRQESYPFETLSVLRLTEQRFC